MWMRRVSVTHPLQVVFTDAGRHVVEVQHTRRRLDDVLGGLTGAGEAVVAGHGEVLVAAGAVLQLEHLTGDDGVLLRHADHREHNTHIHQSESYTHTDVRASV